MNNPISENKLRLALPRASRDFLERNGILSIAPKVSSADPHMIRQRREKKMSRLQEEFLNRLKLLHPLPQIVLSEAITFEIANGCRYTPDCMVIQMIKPADAPQSLCRISAYEVKGFMRDDACVKAKVFARTYTWVDFYLVTRPSKSVQWMQQKINA